MGFPSRDYIGVYGVHLKGLNRGLEVPLEGSYGDMEVRIGPGAATAATCDSGLENWKPYILNPKPRRDVRRLLATGLDLSVMPRVS